MALYPIQNGFKKRTVGADSLVAACGGFSAVGCCLNWLGTVQTKTMAYQFTHYFETKVLVKRPYLTKEMCIAVVDAPLHREHQDDGERVRFWAAVTALEGRYLRVITLKDERTIHNAFPDRRFKP